MEVADAAAEDAHEPEMAAATDVVVVGVAVVAVVAVDGVVAC